MPLNALGRQSAAVTTQSVAVTTQPIAATTDEELIRARAALSGSNIYVLRRLTIDRDGGSLIMRGRVDSYYHKQLAQELVKTAVEGIEVVNALQVIYTPKPDYVIESR